MEYELKTPVDKAELKKLRAGDIVYLTGQVYTARDAAHKKMMDCLDRGEELPFSLPGSAIYYVGPTPEAPGQVIGSAGPTTSGRMDAYSPRLLALGQPLMIGKGQRGPEVIAAMVKYGAVYLAAMGGAGALMSSCIKECSVVCWEELGCEAVRRLYVERMPLTVAIDSLGGNLYETGPAAYLESLKGGE